MIARLADRIVPGVAVLHRGRALSRAQLRGKVKGRNLLIHIVNRNCRTWADTHTQAMPRKPPALRTPADVAREKGVSRQSVYTAIQRGTLTEHRVSGTALLVVCDRKLEAYLARPPQPGPPPKDDDGTADGSADSDR